MVEQRANLDYGADDTHIEDDLTHQPAIDADPIPLEATYVVEEVVVVEDVADDDLERETEVNSEATTYGAP